MAGGGTDVSPFSEMFGGAILNSTINLFAHSSISPRTDNIIRIHAVDRGELFECTATDFIPIDGTLDLQKGVCNRMFKEYMDEPCGFDLITHIDAPSGSGLGTSSTLVVSVLGAFVEWLNLPLGEYDIARLAYDIERKDLSMDGGKQDQYAATFGGVNFMEFHQDDKVIVNPLRIQEEVLHDLEFHLLLYYTETNRKSANIIKEQSENVRSSNIDSLEATKSLKEQAYMMKEALLKKELHKVGEVLDYGWKNKKKMAKGISNELIDQTYDAAIKAGATGGKISGAGGGGFMIFYCPGNSRYDVMKALDSLGGKIHRYNFTNTGMTTWKSIQ